MTPKAGQRVCLILMLLLGIYTTNVLATNISLAIVGVVQANGDDGEYEIDYAATPASIRTASRVSTYGLFCVGAYSVWTARRRKNLRKALLVYVGMVGLSLFLLAFKTTTPIAVISSYGVWGNFGIGTIGIAGIFFLSAREEVWPVLRQYLGLFVVGMAIAVFALAPSVEPGSRASARQYLLELAPTLQLCAVMPLFWRPRYVPRVLCYLPLVAIFVCGILTQTRGYFLITTVELLAIAIVRRRKFLGALLRPRIAPFRLGVLILLAVAVPILAAVAVAGPLRQSMISFTGRFGEDTRSGQVAAFFAKVPPSKLLLGVGYPVGDEFTSEGISGIDSGYINAMYIGGIPALFCFLYFAVVPGMRLLASRPSALSLEVAPVLLAGSVAFISSFVFNLSTGFVIVLLCSGRAYALVSNPQRLLRGLPQPELAVLEVA